MSYWITTHWPTCKDPPLQSRHVFVKDRARKVPVKDDVVFIYESQTAPVREAERRHHGKRDKVKIPKGAGGIIYKVRVRSNTRRPYNDNDVVCDYGNLHEWKIIECDEPPQEVSFLSRADLMKKIGKTPKAGAMFLRLWKIPDEYCPGFDKL